MKAIDDDYIYPEEERVLHDYLFSVEIWGPYELSFFSSCSPLLSVQLLTKHTGKCWKPIFARSWKKIET